MPRRSRPRTSIQQQRAAASSTSEMPVAQDPAEAGIEVSHQPNDKTSTTEIGTTATSADIGSSAAFITDIPSEASDDTGQADALIIEVSDETAADPAPLKPAPKRTSKRAPQSASVTPAATAPPAASAVPAPPAAPPQPQIPVTLRPWSGGDLPLLGRLMGDPAMTAHLGGPETAKELRERHVRYCNIEPNGGMMYVILAGDNQKPAGSVGYWEHEWHGQMVWETGWSVLPEFQGMGVATQATLAVIAAARANGRHRTLHAYPSVENAASNGVCRKAGFTLLGAVDFDYRRAPGGVLRCNDWCIDLFPR